MDIFVFNPEHDIALASNLTNFTAPHAGRQLRSDLGWLPALWAGPDDVVLVDSKEHAKRAWNRMKHRFGRADVTFIEKDEIHAFADSEVKPWGWDLALRAYLLRHGVTKVPTESDIQLMRRLSHRMTASVLLNRLRGLDGTVGISFRAYDVVSVSLLATQMGRIVVKAPWSSSGRGLRFLSHSIDDAQKRWLQHVISSQGSVMVEPQYDKVCDLGMEFESTAQGIHYLGLSLFHTKNGAYTGNVLASEEDKQEMISRYISLELLGKVRDLIIASPDLEGYRGPFGVDMMVVRHSTSSTQHQTLLHPCVEVNLRRTMGHVSLALSPQDGSRKVMRIDYNGKNYKLKINKL